MTTELLLMQYHLEGASFSQLDGYGSVNFKVNHRGQNYILKHYAEVNDLKLIEAENRVLIHLSNTCKLNLPEVKKPIATLTNNGFVRLLSYIEGNLLKKEHLTPDFLVSLGKGMAELNLKLTELNEPAIAARTSSWDNQYAHVNQKKTKHLNSPHELKLVEHFLDRFKTLVLPSQHELRSQIIHGDLNENNILVNEHGQLSGFIDFGDICHSPLINELAIASTYILLLDSENYVSNLTVLVKSYDSVLALQRQEVELLYDLIATRMCTSVLHSAEAKAQNGATEYILQNEAPAWSALNLWSTISPIFLSEHLLKALGFKVQKQSSSDLLKRRKASSSDSLSLSYNEPIHMESSLFQYMFDTNGNRYLDAYNNIPHVGHCHPKVVRAISEQARKLNTNTRYLYTIYADYSEHLLSYFPAHLNKLLLVNSGSAASDLAIRIARTATGRKHIAVLDHGYHGNTMLAIEASAYKFDGKGGDGAASHVIKLPLPKVFNGSQPNGKAYAEEAITILNAEIKKGNTPALFMAEPISGCGGQVPLAPDYLTHLLPFLKEHDILYASDEVQTGFGRLGTHFWGFEFHNVKPDLVILGKPMGNGHPMGGVVTSEKLTYLFSNGMEFFSSFGGNPVSCAVGKSVLEIIDSEQLQQNAHVVGSYWKEGLVALQRRFSVIGDVRGHGIFLGVEFVDSELSPLTQLAGKVKNRLKDHFILTSTDGPFDNVLKMKPSLCFSKENVDEFMFCLKSTLSELV